MKTIGIITANYNRKQICELWCAMVNRLRRDTETYIPAVVVSGAEDKTACDKYHIIHIEQDNLPVSAKYNRAMSYMRSLGIDYVLISGSDNSFSTNTWLRIVAEAEKGYDVIGVSNIYFFSTDGMHRGEMVNLKAKNMLGVAKTISSRVLDRVDWKPWSKDKNHGLDGLASVTIKPYVQTTKMLDDVEVWDIKNSVQQLNRFNFWWQKIKVKENPQKLYSTLGEEEMNILNSIMKCRR